MPDRQSRTHGPRHASRFDRDSFRGTRIVAAPLGVLRERGAPRGVASLRIGGGEAAALAIEPPRRRSRAAARRCGGGSGVAARRGAPRRRLTSSAH
ncbi:hypothetical protein [Burkholderia thailandensis]|uniref:hypothetical protein n=2 Tax=Burkholderia thailandensis TaxID=57975 RepID=UPI000AEB417D|nr:hypothetical protein [Burkholderia thailandensis]QIO10495.1 hypothetical protein G9462_01655 [Burkholderia thailandensis]WRS67558.1 hypothetical protein U9S59_15960 [Burkholderia thailandensis]